MSQKEQSCLAGSDVAFEQVSKAVDMCLLSIGRASQLVSANAEFKDNCRQDYNSLPQAEGETAGCHHTLSVLTADLTPFFMKGFF